MARQSPEIINQLVEQDYDYNEIKSYLALLLDGQSIPVYHNNNQIAYPLDPEQGWEFIEEWAIKHNFSISRRKSRHNKIETLIGDIDEKLKRGRDAANATKAILDSADTHYAPPPEVRSGMSDSLRKSLDLTNRLIDEHNKRVLSPIYQIYYGSPLLAHIKDEGLRKRAAIALSSNPHLAASFQVDPTPLGRIHIAGAINETHQLLRQTIPELEPFYQELRSDQLEQDAERTFQIAKVKLQELYPGQTKSGIDFQALNKDMRSLRLVAGSAMTFALLDDYVDAIPTTYLGASAAEKKALLKDIRKIVVAASSGPHLSGDQLLKELVRTKKLPPEAVEKLKFLAPQLEILENQARSELIRATVTDRKRNRELWTQGIAETLGLNASTFWLKEKELAQATTHFLAEYKVTTLKDAIALELAKEKPDLGKYSSLIDLQNKNYQLRLYRADSAGNILVRGQDLLSKFNYNYRILREPWDKANRRLWAAIEKVDDVINFPARTLATFWENLVDGKLVVGKFSRNVPTVVRVGKTRIHILDPMGTLFSLYGRAQKSLAVSTFKWSYGLAQRGVLPSIFRPISNYAFVFTQHDGFRETNFYFGRKIAGNFLNWTSQKIWKKSWSAVKTGAKEALWKVGNKVTGGLLAKGAAYLASLGLSVEGIGIVTTIALVTWDLLKLAVSSIDRFFKDAKFRDKILNLIPITVGVGATFIGIVQGLPALIGLGILTLLGFFGTAFGSIAVIFAQAVLWAGGALVLAIMFYHLFKISTQIDPGLRIQEMVNAYQCEAGDDSAKPPAGSVLFSDDGQYAFPVSGAPGYGCYHWDGDQAVDIFTGQASSTDPQQNLPVIAYESGTIVNVVNNDSLGGRYIILQGSTSGRFYYYAHNCSIFVTGGQSVSAGDVIATTDQSGLNAAVTPEHLHFAISSGDNFTGGGSVCAQRDFFEKFSSLRDRCTGTMCVPGIPN